MDESDEAELFFDELFAGRSPRRRAPARPSAEQVLGMSPAALFDAVVHGRPTITREAAQRFEVVARPGEPFVDRLRPEDLVIRRARGDGRLAQVSVLVDGLPRSWEALVEGGYRPEPHQAGLYALVEERGPLRHEASEGFARWLGGPAGALGPDQLVVRPRSRAAAGWGHEEVGGLGPEVGGNPTLVRVVVEGANRVGNNDWSALYENGQYIELRAVASPNEQQALNQVVWGGNGLVAVPNAPHRRRISRGALRNRSAITVTLGRTTIRVHVAVLPKLVGITVQNAVADGTSKWKTWIGNAPAVATAEVLPATNEVRAQLRWRLGGPVTAINNQPASVNVDRAQEHVRPAATLQVTLGRQTVSHTVSVRKVPVLRLHSVTFSNNHPIDNDTLGPIPALNAPHWQRVPNAANVSHPVCYTRNTAPTLEAVFDVTTRPSVDETITFEGRVALGGVNLVFTANVLVPVRGRARATTGPIASGNSLANVVATHAGAQIVWTAAPQGAGVLAPAAPAGTSTNDVYVTLGNPAMGGVTLYLTLLDISCRAAAGVSTAPALVAGAFTPFTTRNTIRRKRDGQTLKYWNPRTTDAMTTQELLARADGSGQCGSLAELFRDMCRAHGVGTVHKVIIAHNSYLNLVPLAPPAPYSAILVKNWHFNNPPAWSGTAFTHNVPAQAHYVMGLPGQHNPAPPPVFDNHFVVVSGGSIFDPSYGVQFGNTAQWEVAAIDGLASVPGPPRVGFKKSIVGVTRLLTYLDMVTGANL